MLSGIRKKVIYSPANMWLSRLEEVSEKRKIALCRQEHDEKIRFTVFHPIL